MLPYKYKNTQDIVHFVYIDICMIYDIYMYERDYILRSCLIMTCSSLCEMYPSLGRFFNTYVLYSIRKEFGSRL